MTARSAPPSPFPLEMSPDGRRVHWVDLDEQGYRAASFLDGRLLAGGTPPSSRWEPWEVGEGAGRPPRLHFIFHQGHVGSTLLSRLLGEHPALFALREPALLRELALGRWAERTDALLRLLSRTWRPEQTAVVKATSFVSEIGPDLVARSGGGAAILLSASPGAYLRTILAGPASREEAAALAEVRRARLERRLDAAVAPQGAGERIAMGWLAELLALDAVAQAAPGRWLWLDFDQLLAEPAVALEAALRRLEADPAALDLAALLAGPILRRYSKGPEHAYDAALRRSLLDQAERQEGAEVRRGMDWLQRAASAYPAIQPALRRAAAARRAPLAGPPGPP